MNDEFEGVNKKIDESKQRLDESLLANKEQEDIEARRCNIILYRVEESKEVLPADRMKQDLSFCLRQETWDLVSTKRISKKSLDQAK